MIKILKALEEAERGAKEAFNTKELTGESNEEIVKEAFDLSIFEIMSDITMVEIAEMTTKDADKLEMILRDREIARKTLANMVSISMKYMAFALALREKVEGGNEI